jgi:hypothetical protein
MSMIGLTRLVTLAALLLASPVFAVSPPCQGGRFVLDPDPKNGELIVGSGTQVVVVNGNSVSIDSACPVSALKKGKVKGTKKATKVTAQWFNCTDNKQNVRLTATIATDPDPVKNCTVMKGTRQAKKTKARKFTAHFSSCGDSILDPGNGEQCDGSSGTCSSGPCTLNCTCPLVTTTTSSSTTSTNTTETTTTSSSSSVTTSTSSTVSTSSSSRSSTSSSTTSTTSSTTSSSAPQATTSSTSTTTTSTPPQVCGDHIVEDPETCDDGNTVDMNTVPIVVGQPLDSCPANCRIQGCVAVANPSRTVSVNVASATAVGGITVFVDYPDGHVSIPGNGSATVVKARIKNLPANTASTPNDIDYGLVEVLIGSGSAFPTRLFTITFDDCQGATPPVAGDFHCVVKDASDTGGGTLHNVACSVSIP